LKIKIFYDQVKFRIQKSKSVLDLIEKVIRSENKVPGDLNFIITSDRIVKEINKEFLKHNYFTDVIAFDNSEGRIVNGEIYISIERVKMNAINYKVSLNDEILRVMVHGVLHLCGYEDGTQKKKMEMSGIEERWINTYKNL